MKIKDIMTTDLSVCHMETSLQVVSSMLSKNKIGAVTVVDNNRSPLKLITEQELLAHCLYKDNVLSQYKVSDFINQKELYICFNDDDINIALSIMYDRKVSRLPVANCERSLVGIISLSDIANHSSVCEYI